MPDPKSYASPERASYDVVIVGGAMIGSSIAWFLSADPNFDGRVLVVERDPTYEHSSTAHTNSCIRQQFSTETNIQISQFGAAFIKTFRDQLGGDPDIPDIPLQSFGYMYLAADAPFADVLRSNQLLQANFGAATQILTPDDIKAAYPFYNIDDIVCGSHNLVDEGYFDGGTMFDWWKRKARQNGVEYIANEVVGIATTSGRVQSVQLATGESIAADWLVNASGPRAAQTARMAGIDLPVEPRRRYTFIFDAAERLDRDLPLTIDPSGVHMRTDGRYYLAGCPPYDDRAMEPDDFSAEDGIWEEKVWPALAHRVPAFERAKLINEWVGHYAYNTLDQNAIVGPHPEVTNFIFANGFSGHGFQQSPAIGCSVSEWIANGAFRTLDLTPLSFDRIAANEPLLERAVI
ncbi:MAG: FAD-binding oxidoreductase [Pseudomonadota bacterium]